LGWQAYTAPPSTFFKSRLDKLGGPDFAESSFLGAHYAAMGVLAATFVLGSRQWWGKLLALLVGGMVFNGLVLTRTRAAYVAVVAGIVAAVFFADRNLRKSILALLALGWLICPLFIDEGFWERIGTITTNQQEMEESSFSRWQFWQGAMRMWADHPMGVGPGRFFGEIGHYLPEHPGRDTHSTYLRCLAELGIPGVIALGLLIVNAFRTLRWCKRTARAELDSHELTCFAWGLQVMLVVFLVAGVFMSMTYMEELFLMLALPACLQRAIWNETAKREEVEMEDAADE
jgi:putative inorganic carbon (hco3(-)) transporter